MPILKILTFPDKFLRQPTKPVENIDEEIQKVIDGMAGIMYEAPGVGLAAIQVGYDKSIIVYDVSLKEKKRSLQVLINPKIISSEGKIVSENEGCLSVPDLRVDIKRSVSILVEGLDREGKPLKIKADELLALVLQHEIDHLNGTLIIDHISSLKRQLYKRHVQKALRKT